MARNLTSIEISDLEDMVDAVGIQGIMRGLAEIAEGKAEHLTSDWQDASGSREWARIARYLGSQSTNRIIASPLD